jgi:hypothetical protein
MFRPALEAGRNITRGYGLKENSMKNKHGFLFGFAVIAMAAIFTLAGCDDGSDDDGGENKDVNGKPLLGITIISPPTKEAYWKGEDLDIDGLVVKASFLDNTEDEDYKGYKLTIYSAGSETEIENGYKLDTTGDVRIDVVTGQEYVGNPIKSELRLNVFENLTKGDFKGNWKESYYGGNGIYYKGEFSTETPPAKLTITCMKNGSTEAIRVLNLSWAESATSYFEDRTDSDITLPGYANTDIAIGGSAVYTGSSTGNWNTTAEISGKTVLGDDGNTLAANPKLVIQQTPSIGVYKDLFLFAGGSYLNLGQLVVPVVD